MMSSTNILTSLFLLPSLARVAFSAVTKRATACNNSPDLCSKAYNNVTYLGAHNSPFLRDTSTGNSESGNQFYNSTVQLSAGVRLLTGQVHNNNGSLHMCHTSCTLLDAGLLSDWLSEIKTWMDGNPNEVVTVLLVNSDDSSASDLASAYTTAGITSYAYTPTSTTAPTEWPTLQTLINDGKRLLNFVASLSDNTAAPYLMDEFTYIFENNYDNTSPSNFSCAANRPSTVTTSSALQQNLMPLMNHFLYETTDLFGTTIESPDLGNISTTNSASGGTGALGTSATECTTTYGQAPTYLLVDFFNVGPAIETADRLNGVTSPVGRTNVSTAASAPASSGSTRSGVSTFSLVTALIVAFVLIA
ncbi:hypothetical protein E4T50_04436 [Aureobasidium sp. EXF-12298]|nr:hypothetical protein E4T50_04436 [Aureobasidium sp. EXF-12298]KAI4766063.1 hypothetical protein E4T51_00885 [Aureobasidium sp. EXF-12344]KAI4783576.1 hypothetical protein E4T52_01419 [Aureobasidium sp. EXF-3400]